jgi:hypothetical protein
MATMVVIVIGREAQRRRAIYRFCRVSHLSVFSADESHDCEIAAEQYQLPERPKPVDRKSDRMVIGSALESGAAAG